MQLFQPWYIFLTGSIFMTVGIALERFIAVHYPINYSQAMMEANALHKRVFKYVFSVTVLLLDLNLNPRCYNHIILSAYKIRAPM